METPEHYLCPDRACSGGTWVLEQQNALHNLWLLVNVSDQSIWLLAADEPVCPRCGTSLVTPLELEGGYTSSEVLENGPMLCWMQTLRWSQPAA